MIDVIRFLRTKRDRGTHDAAAIADFVAGLVARRIPDYQVSAWLMAAFLNGLDHEETTALTSAMIDSGVCLDWQDLGRPSAGKHSTGGVGDKVSLVLAPLVAACGVLVPMIAGRGLGHTGGTLDKLAAIPGFRVDLDADAMRAQLDRLGVVVVGQGPNLVPADGLLYSLRDVTGTVEFEPFITSSIVSKKIAEGSRSLVYDVKCGNGAFMKSLPAARSLAERLVASTRALGRAASARITDMSQPLGQAVGNALEIRETMDLLRGGGPADVRDLTLELGAAMLVTAGVEREFEAATSRLIGALDGGEAMRCFLAMIEAQGGDAGLVERDQLPRAPCHLVVEADRPGYLTGVDTFGLGMLAVDLGAGRRRTEDRIDPRVGLTVRVRLGARVGIGDPLIDLWSSRPVPESVSVARSCFEITDRPIAPPPLLYDRIDATPGVGPGGAP